MKNNNYYTLKDCLSEIEVSLEYLSLLNLKKEINISNLEKVIKNINNAIGYISSILKKSSMSFYGDLKSSLSYLGFAKSHLNLIYDIDDHDQKIIEKVITHLNNVKNSIETIVGHSSKKEI